LDLIKDVGYQLMKNLLLVLLILPLTSFACPALSEEQEAYNKLQAAAAEYREARRLEEIKKILQQINK
jgi:hypothetical protein